MRWAKIDLPPENIMPEQSRMKFIYRYGKQFCIDKVLIGAAIYDFDAPSLNKLLKAIENSVVPIFPLRGRDIVNKGITDDNLIGKKLRLLEQMWIDSNFSLTRDELLNMIEK